MPNSFSIARRLGHPSATGVHMEHEIPAEWRVLLAVLEERLESIDNKLAEMVATQQKKNEDIETRLRTVERWTYTVPAALISSVISIIAMIVRG